MTTFAQNLAISKCNLLLASEAMEKIKQQSARLSHDAQQNLALLHIGIALSLDALESAELKIFIARGEKENGGSSPF